MYSCYGKAEFSAPLWNIEKIAFKSVQTKSVAINSTNQKFSFKIFTVEHLQNIFMIFTYHKRKIDNFDIFGYCYKYIRAI